MPPVYAVTFTLASGNFFRQKCSQVLSSAASVPWLLKTSSIFRKSRAS